MVDSLGAVSDEDSTERPPVWTPECDLHVIEHAVVDGTTFSPRRREVFVETVEQFQLDRCSCPPVNLVAVDRAQADAPNRRCNDLE